MDEQKDLGLKEDGITTVEKYKFEPIKGYPMLSWKGKRPFKSTQYFPAQLREVYGEKKDRWINEIYWGDNLQVMSHLLKKYRGMIDLIYLDPPFDSKADYKKKIKLRGKEVENDHMAFEEKQYSDIWTNDEYLQFMYERLILLRELLSERGSIYLHCDYRKVHHLRCIMDEIFGKSNFQNHLIWVYEGRETTKTKYNDKHEDLLFYSKSDRFIFNFEEILEPLKESSRKAMSKFVDEEGNPYIIRYTDGGGFAPKEIEGKTYRQYVPDGVPPRDWFFVDYARKTERTGYPTQKPEALLERIIKASSKPGDIVFDSFMGSGTTQSVAMKLGRKFIGADINLGAIQVTKKRLIQVANEIEEEQPEIEFETDEGTKKIEKFYTGFEVYNVNNYDVFRNPVQAKELLIEALEIQPLPQNALYDGEKDGRLVKIMPVNRIAARQDLNELISNFDYKIFEKRSSERPNKAVESLMLVCMGHEPDLAAYLQKAIGDKYKLDIEIVDVLRDKAEIQFKRDSEVEIEFEGKVLNIMKFYPMNLLGKLSMMKENVKDWRELVDSIMIDYDFDGEIMKPQIVDVPEKNEMVKGKYKIPEEYGKIRVKITDLLSESIEVEV